MSSVQGIAQVTSLLAAAMLAGCATSVMPDGPDTAGSSNSRSGRTCDNLRLVIDQESVGFRDIREHKTSTRMATLWEARPVFASGECLIWEWAADRTNYVCTWKHADESTARRLYEEYVPVVADCLGPAWTAAEKTMQTGRATAFSGPANTNVYLLYFQEKGGASAGWSTNLVVGDDVRMSP
ncbi:MAG: hypothetical protein PVH31_06460 [Ectothiorhodospiraceae bacterium]|jgi:hypothetical protein